MEEAKVPSADANDWVIRFGKALQSQPSLSVDNGEDPLINIVANVDHLPPLHPLHAPLQPQGHLLPYLI